MRMRICNAWLMLGLAIGALAAPGRVKARDVETLTIGSKAPDFRLPGVDGKTYTLQDFADAKILMVVFTCNHCPTAQAYESRIKKLHQDYRDRGVALVAISPNDAQSVRLDELGYSELGDSLAEMKIRANDQGFEFPYLYDGETQTTSATFGVLATPHVFIFDADRVLRYVGRIDDSEIKTPTRHEARQALERLLAGESVEVPETRVFGCSTKWADKRQAAQDALAAWNQEEVRLQTVSPDQLRVQLTRESENYRLVNVWATWCSPCVEELHELVTIHRMYRKRHFEVITVSADDQSKHAEAQELLAQKHCSATNYILDTDSRDALFDAVDPQWKGAVPYTALISPEGKVVLRIHGEFDPLELKREIVNRLGRTYAAKK